MIHDLKVIPMKRILLLAAFTISMFGVTSCTTEAPPTDAQLMTIQELNSSAGYAWFPSETSLYTPNAAIVNQLKTSFDTNTQKITVYVKPACSCKGTQKLFPQVMKTLFAANIPMRCVTIYSMRSSADKHPMMDKFVVSTLPVFYITRNDSIRSSIVEIDYTGDNADSLTLRAILR